LLHSASQGFASWIVLADPIWKAALLEPGQATGSVDMTRSDVKDIVLILVFAAMIAALVLWLLW
jgi:hypothetical protein